MGSCLGVGTNFNPRLRTSSSVGDRTASERLTTVLRVVSVKYTASSILQGGTEQHQEAAIKTCVTW